MFRQMQHGLGLKTDISQRNGQGTSVLGPVNKDRDRQNPDLVRPPSTDHGILPNLRW
jgi:hypothetical protein